MKAMVWKKDPGIPIYVLWLFNRVTLSLKVGKYKKVAVEGGCGNILGGIFQKWSTKHVVLYHGAYTDEEF